MLKAPEKMLRTLHWATVALFVLVLLVWIPWRERDHTCGNCAVAASRNVWYLSLLAPGAVASAVLLRLYRRERRRACLVIPVLTATVIVFMGVSMTLHGKPIAHNSALDVAATITGYGWWMALMLSGLFGRAFGSVRLLPPTVKRTTFLIAAVVHLGLLVICLEDLWLRTRFDIPLWTG